MSCILWFIGCTDPSALNYDSNATTDDGSCIAVLQGCIEVSACNYDSSANTDDGSCTYPITWYWDTDGDGLGDDYFSMSSCDQPGPEFVDNIDDPVMYSI